MFDELGWGTRRPRLLGRDAGRRGEPQTNGVIERFWKTLKKQVLEGRIYQTLADLRVALAVFMDLYNRAWRLEKLGGGYEAPPWKKPRGCAARDPSINGRLG